MSDSAIPPVVAENLQEINGLVARLADSTQPLHHSDEDTLLEATHLILRVLRVATKSIAA